jgi:hypothetical protein
VLLAAITARFAHGLVILAAPDSNDAHENWDPATEPVHGGPDSVYVSVVSAPSGLATIECFDGTDFPQDLIQLYAGELHLESRKFLLYDPNETVLLTVLTDSAQVRITLFGDDPEDPATVRVFVNSI